MFGVGFVLNLFVCLCTLKQDALERGTRQSAAAAARARAESERLRLAGNDADATDAILGGVPTAGELEDEGDVVAVFGEIVEVRWMYGRDSIDCIWIDS